MSTTPGDAQPPHEDGPGSGWGQQAGGEQAPGPPGQSPPPGQAPPPGYGAPPPAGYAADHPQTTTVLVLGILGVVLCQVLAPFAWVMGRRVVREIDAAGGRVGGRGPAQAGYVLGIVGTVILGISVLFLIGYAIVAVVFIAGGVANA